MIIIIIIVHALNDTISQHKILKYGIQLSPILMSVYISSNYVVTYTSSSLKLLQIMCCQQQSYSL